MNNRVKRVGAALAILATHGVSLGTTASDAKTDCISSAARYHRVNEVVLRAIIWGESRMRPNARNVNDNGSVDVGAAQTNSIHFRELSRFGITPDHLMDGCVSVYVGAWMYSKHVAVLGDTWEAVGAYHSKTPYFQQAYANGVAETLSKWGKLPANWRPFASAPKNTTEAIRLRKSQAGTKTPSPQPNTALRYASSITATAE